MDEKLISLNLSVADVNVCLEALSNQPFKDVANLINSVHKQAAEQLQNEPAPLDGEDEGILS